MVEIVEVVVVLVAVALNVVVEMLAVVVVLDGLAPGFGSEGMPVFGEGITALDVTTVATHEILGTIGDRIDPFASSTT